MPPIPRAWRALLALLTLLAACGAPPAPAAPAATNMPTDQAGEPVTITFAAPEFERAAYEPLIAAFEAENPDLRVRFVSLDEVSGAGGDSFDPAAMLRNTVSAADTALPLFVRPDDVASGMLLDLAPLMDADPAFERGDYYPGALAHDGATFLLPRTLNVPLLAYNKDLWASAGLPEPGRDWSWDEFLAAAERLATRRGDTVDTYGYVDTSAVLTALLGALAAGGDALLDDPAARIDRPEVAAALARVAVLVEQGALWRPQSGGVNFGELQQLLASGRAAMWPDGLLAPALDGSPPAFAVGVTPYPQPALGVARGPAASGYVISAGTQHPQEAWRWLSFASRQHVARPAGLVLIGGGRSVPARRSVAEQSGFWDAMDAPTRAAIEAALAQPTAANSAAGQSDVQQALGAALERVIGGETPARALADAQSALEQARATPSATPTPAGPIIVATPEPDNVPAGATTIRFAAFAIAPAELRKLARAFSEANPAVHVEFLSDPGIVVGDTPLAEQADCGIVPGSPDATNPLTGTLDLRPFAEADPTFDLGDYPPALLAPFERDGGLRGLPYGARLRALTYNQDAFRAAGLEPPQATWTLDDFLNAAQQLTLDGDERTRSYGFASNGVMTADLRFFLDRAGVSLTSGSGNATKPNLTDPALVQAVQRSIDLLRNTSPHTRLDGYRADEPLALGTSFELVQNGRVGMWFDFGLDGVMIRIGGLEQPAFTRAIAPPPLGNSAATPNDIQPIGMYISASSSAPDACWAWLSYLSRDTTLLGDAYPARRSLAESEVFLRTARPGAAAVYEAYRDALEQPQGGGVEGGEALLDPFWFYQAVDRALQGADLERELEQAQQRSEQFMACVQGGGKRGECARAVDPEYGGFAVQ
jgi:ABC-type glycerol-3-phosphate transport system substrate-binding protein